MKNECRFGSWCQLGHPGNAEILARAGFDFITLDCEHGETENADIRNFCRVVSLSGAQPLVRVAENSVMPIRRALDLGAAGVIVPLVETEDDARRAVAAANYPPKGIRGFAWCGANNWGKDFDTYVTVFRPQVSLMCESVRAVENIDAILEVDGVDGVVIGPYDLSGSMGTPGETSHPDVVAACAKVAEACLRHRKFAGQHIVTPNAENVSLALKQGYTFIALGMDTWFMSDGARAALELVK